MAKPRPAPTAAELAAWAQYRAGCAACLKYMSDEGKARARAFWETNKPKAPTAR